jgi:hypothetical protein
MYKLAVILFLSVFSCSRFNKNSNDKIIARVHDEYLYASDIKNVMPDNLSGKDSIAYVNDYLNKWVRKQLLLVQAELNLTDTEKDVERQIEEYEASLLIFKYEQKFLNQMLDTMVSQSEIEDYYNNYSNNFILDRNIFKGVFVKVPRSAPSISTLRNNLRYKFDETEEDIEVYCRQHAEVYDNFSNTWRDFENMAQTLPKSIYNTESYLRYRKFDEVRDTNYYYFLRIEDFALANNTKPFDYVADDIRSIIINKRKVKLINELEANIYNDGLNHSYFNIY